MKNLLDAKTTVPVEVALDLLVSTLQDYTYKNPMAKDKEWLRIALLEIGILENSIIAAVK